MLLSASRLCCTLIHTFKTENSSQTWGFVLNIWKTNSLNSDIFESHMHFHESVKVGGGFSTVKLCSEASCSYGAFVLLCFHSSCFLYFSLIFPEVCEDWQLANSLPVQPQGHCRRTSPITPQLAPSPALVFSLNLLKRREFGHCDGGECRNSFGLEL